MSKNTPDESIPVWPDTAAWEKLRESIEKSGGIPRASITVTLPKHPPPTVLKSTSDGIYPVLESDLGSKNPKFKYYKNRYSDNKK